LRRPLLAALGLAFSLGLPARALAQPQPAPFTLIDDEADLGKDKPPAADTRTGHVYVQPRFGMVAPAGKLAAAPDRLSSSTTSTAASAGTPTSQLAGTGMSFGATVGVGITRHAVIEAVGQYARYGAPTACEGCSGSSIDLGLGVSYHLAQGVAIDPWISYGVGLRFATFLAHPTSQNGGPTSAPLESQGFRGFDVARLALGADFYPVPAFGLGPYFEADVGTAFARHDPTLGPAVYGFFQLGIRIAFDPFQRTLRPTPAASKASARR
jgi:hypothetical protein